MFAKPVIFHYKCIVNSNINFSRIKKWTLMYTTQQHFGFPKIWKLFQVFLFTLYPLGFEIINSSLDSNFAYQHTFWHALWIDNFSYMTKIGVWIASKLACFVCLTYHHCATKRLQLNLFWMLLILLIKQNLGYHFLLRFCENWSPVKKRLKRTT